MAIFSAGRTRRSRRRRVRFSSRIKAATQALRQLYRLIVVAIEVVGMFTILVMVAQQGFSHVIKQPGTSSAPVTDQRGVGWRPAGISRGCESSVTHVHAEAQAGRSDDIAVGRRADAVVGSATARARGAFEDFRQPRAMRSHSSSTEC